MALPENFCTWGVEDILDILSGGSEKSAKFALFWRQIFSV